MPYTRRRKYRKFAKRTGRKRFGRRRVARRRPRAVQFRGRSRSLRRPTSKLMRGVKHSLNLVKRTPMLKTCWNYVFAYDKCFNVNKIITNGYPFNDADMIFRMNSLYDPHWSTAAGTFDTSVAYHKYMSRLYREYRVLACHVTCYVKTLHPASMNTTAGRSTEEDQYRFSSGMALSLKMDDTEEDPLNSKFYWTNLKTDPTARTTIIPPALDGAPHITTLKHSWYLPKAERSMDNTWFLCAGNPDPSMINNRGLCRIFLQREDMRAYPAVNKGFWTTAFCHFGMAVKCVYICQYRYPYDPTDLTEVVLGQHDDETPDDFVWPEEPEDAVPDIPVGPDPEVEPKEEIVQ